MPAGFVWQYDRQIVLLAVLCRIILLNDAADCCVRSLRRWLILPSFLVIRRRRRLMQRWLFVSSWIVECYRLRSVCRFRLLPCWVVVGHWLSLWLLLRGQRL